MSALDAIRDYLDTIGKIPLLTHDEELILARSVQEWIENRDSDNPCPRIARRGKRALDRMVQGNLRLVVSASRKFQSRGYTITLMDLIQEGNIGLIKAAERFDPSRGYKFSTYAYWWIRQAMHRVLAQHDRIIHIPTAAYDILNNVRHFAVRFKHEHDRPPTIEECAAECSVTPDTMRHYLMHASGCKSLDQPSLSTAAESNSSHLADLIPSDITNSVDDVQASITAENVGIWMNTLTEKEATVINSLYGLNNHPQESMSTIGKEMGVCREAVRQTQMRALRKIRFVSGLQCAA
jgi:RNA polymerase sigma factor (sigma-70 family)